MTINQPPLSGSVEQKLREEVAACTLILNSLDILGYSGHVSARLPDGKHLLIQSFDQSRASLRPDDLLICDLDGVVVAGPEGIRAPAEVYLHTEILRARPDVQAVAHFHDDLATTFTIVKNRPLLARQEPCNPLGERYSRSPGSKSRERCHSWQGARGDAGAKAGAADQGPWSGDCRRIGQASLDQFDPFR